MNRPERRSFFKKFCKYVVQSPKNFFLPLNGAQKNLSIITMRFKERRFYLCFPENSGVYYCEVETVLREHRYGNQDMIAERAIPDGPQVEQKSFLHLQKMTKKS